MKNNQDINDRAIAQIIAATVAMEFGVKITLVFKKKKGANYIIFTRQTAMYLMHIVFQISFARIGRAFGRDRSTVTHACHVIEDYREDPIFDEKLIKLEGFLETMPVPVLLEKAA